MSVQINLREALISKIKELREERLEKILQFIQELEKEERIKRLKSYAGMLEDFDDEVMEGLTTKLPQKRLNNSLEF